MRLRPLAILLLTLERRRIAHPKGLGLRRFSNRDYSRDLRPVEWGSGVGLRGGTQKSSADAATSAKWGAPQDRADLNRRPDATASRRHAARHRLLTAALVSLERLHLCCKGSCEFVESSLALSCCGNPHHRQIFDFVGTENRSTADSKISRNGKHASLSTSARIHANNRFYSMTWVGGDDHL